MTLTLTLTLTLNPHPNPYPNQEPHAQLSGCAPIDALIAEGRARVLCADGYKAVRVRDAGGDGDGGG